MKETPLKPRSETPMIDDRIDRLIGLPQERSLDGLESEIWAKIDADAQSRRTAGLVLGCQAAAVAAVLAGGLAMGNLSPGPQANAHARLDVFSPETALAPSTLLLGPKI
jgi:hypothetical protein